MTAFTLHSKTIGAAMHKTFRNFNGKTYMLDELSYFGLGVRCIKEANGKYVIYREYIGDINKEDGSSFFSVG